MASLQDLLKNGIRGPQTTVDSISGGMSNRQTIPTTTPTRVRDILRIQKPASIAPLLNTMQDKAIVSAPKPITTSENLNPSGVSMADKLYAFKKIKSVTGGQTPDDTVKPVFEEQQYQGEMPAFSGNDVVDTGTPTVAKFDITTFKPADYFNTNTDELSNDDLYKIRKAITRKQLDTYSAAIDPQKIAQLTGGVFNPEQMRNFTQMAAKQYDAMIDDIDAKIEAREKGAKENSVSNAFYGNAQYGDKNTLGFNDDTVANYVAGTLPTGQKNNFLEAYQNAPDKTDYLRQYGFSKMKAGELEKYEANETMSQNYGLAAGLAEDLKNKIPGGLYGNTVQNLSKYANKSKDPNFINFNSIIQSGQANARVKITGVALSENELKLINSYMVEPNDTIENALTKMKVQKALIDKALERAPYKKLGVKFNPLTLNDIGLGQNNTTDSSDDIQTTPDGKKWRVEPDGSYVEVSFNNVGTDTKRTGSVRSVEDAMARIARNESDGMGGYFAVGPVVKSGQYKGERAIGKYQIMPGNVASWSKEFIGKTITPEELYRNPKYQDQIARGKMMQLYKQYGNWDDVASAWFTGRPLAQGSKAKDVLGTSGAQYVNKFNA